MKRTRGENVRVNVDNTCALVAVDWTCPYCGGYNAGFYSTYDKIKENSFIFEHECEDCGEMAAIECEDAEITIR